MSLSVVALSICPISHEVSPLYSSRENVRGKRRVRIGALCVLGLGMLGAGGASGGPFGVLGVRDASFSVVGESVDGGLVEARSFDAECRARWIAYGLCLLTNPIPEQCEVPDCNVGDDAVIEVLRLVGGARAGAMTQKGVDQPG